MSSVLCVYSVERGMAVGFMRGHGGVCTLFYPEPLLLTKRIANFLYCRSRTSPFIHLHYLLRPNCEDIQS